MKIAIIHSGNNGFFPRFYTNLYNAILKDGSNPFLLSPRSGSNYRTILKGQIFWGSRINWHVHNLLYKITGLKDIYSSLDTLHLISKLHNLKPDVIHFHLINDCILNLPLLIKYINHSGIPVVWTMHDCRAFTGNCPYFDEIDCNKWKSGCGKCPDSQYISSFIDNTALQWKLLKKTLTSIKKLEIVTPSKWLRDFVKQSFLKNFNCSIIYNGIDVSSFSNSYDPDIRTNLKLTDKKIVLGVAAAWTERKGLKFFEKLSQMLPVDYKLVLVGDLPYEIKDIINLPKTSDPKLIASYYNMADMFCNPTLADNFPTTNIEALAAGTPVVTFNTGGSPEAITDKSGLVVNKGDVAALRDAIIAICSSTDCYTKEDCIEAANRFSLSRYDDYVRLYKRLILYR